MSSRLSKNDWLDLGLAALADEGPDGLTIEALCERAQKTRGSYYHHFNSGAAFVEQLLGWWLKTYTRDLIEKVERLGHHGEKLDHLNQLAAHLDPRIEQAFRRLGARNQQAARTCRAVDDARIDYLADLYGQSPRFSADEARMLAQIEYAAWVGFQVIAPDAKPQEMLHMYEMFLRLTGRV